MKSAAELLNNVIPEIKQQLQQTRHSEQTSTIQFLKAALQELSRMGLLTNPTAETYQTWARGLSDLTDKQIRIGMAKSIHHVSYFNLPIFRELCKLRPEDIGLPEVKKAYQEACMAPTPKSKHKWSHPAVYHAGLATGWFELATFAEDQIYPRFKTFYAECCDRVMQGENLETPMMEALPEKVTIILTPEQNQDRLAKLRQEMGI